MATATQISTRALKRIGVIVPGETGNAADIADASEELTGMLNSWEAEGLSGDVLPLDARFEQAIVDMLVVRVAPLFGKEPTQLQFKQADDGWKQISAAFFAVPASQFDTALSYTGHATDVGFIIGGDEPKALAAWQASAAYLLRDTVTNEGGIYECHTAGTSAASGGPTGTADEITDGTVVWVWRRVAG